jgi:endogenous inhibitor of DNA gyrase (YacG/DUF329 family)
MMMEDDEPVYYCAYCGDEVISNDVFWVDGEPYCSEGCALEDDDEVLDPT